MSSTCLRPSHTVRSSITADGLVLLDVSGGVLLSSNVVGGRIWQLIELGATREEIANRLATEYDVGRERAEADVLAFIAALCSHGLVVEEERQ